MTESLEALLQRVQAATGADRRLDADLYVGLQINPEFSNTGAVPGFVYDAPDSGHPVHPYTDSIDVALALVGKLLPGWRWGLVRQQGGESPYAADGYHFWAERGDGGQEVQTGPALTAPLAVLAALLTVLIAQNKGTDQ